MIEIKIIGKGGQGVVVAGEILAHAAVIEGKEASAIAAYGSEARGGEVSSEVVIAAPSDKSAATVKEIPCPFVIDPNFILALSQEAYESSIELIKEETKVIYDSTLIKKIKWERNHFPIPAARGSQREVANVVLLGAFSALTNIVSKEALKLALEEKMKGEVLEINIKALEEGFKAGARWSPLVSEEL